MKSKILKKLESGESDVELTKKYNTRKSIITGIKKYKGEIICMVHICRVHRSIEEV